MLNHSCLESEPREAYDPLFVGSFGRTALLLSGGAAFGVKHLGVVSALHREQLLPRIIAGTSAGSIVAAAVCSRRNDELHELLETTGPALLRKLKFFGLRRGDSSADIQHSMASNSTTYYSRPADSTDAATVDLDLKRWRQRAQRGKTVLDNRTWLFAITIGRSGFVVLTILRHSLPARCTRGHPFGSHRLHNVFGGKCLMAVPSHLPAGSSPMTVFPYLGQAFDRTGRVLNITVTRSDGKAPPLLCNYLTTPQMLVHCASLASCAIPGVFEAVELQAKGRDGKIEPYFKTGRWTWTDGGMQADLPKERLTELFNVNQFIVSQVSPLAPLVVPMCAFSRSHPLVRTFHP